MTWFSPSQTVKSLAPSRAAGRPAAGRQAYGKRRNRRLVAALVFSACFHLSMATLFNIVIAFPREDLRYFQVSIVSSPESGSQRIVPAADPSARTGDMLTLSGTSRFESEVPRVALPILEFAEMERLRIRYENPDRPPPLEGLLEPPGPADSWARFGGELRRLGQSMRGLTFSDDPAAAPSRNREKPRTVAHRPAEGFEAYVEWNTAPHDRELLFAPPVRALWQANPDNLHRPLEIVIKVDAAGRVVNVWSPQIDEDGILDAVQMAVLQYRFAPLPGAETETGGALSPEQSGVLFIRPAKGAS